MQRSIEIFATAEEQGAWLRSSLPSEPWCVVEGMGAGSSTALGASERAMLNDNVLTKRPLVHLGSAALHAPSWHKDARGRVTLDALTSCSVLFEPSLAGDGVLLAGRIARFSSRQGESFSAKVNAALRQQFGGHAVKEAGS